MEDTADIVVRYPIRTVKRGKVLYERPHFLAARCQGMGFLPFLAMISEYDIDEENLPQDARPNTSRFIEDFKDIVDTHLDIQTQRVPWRQRIADDMQEAKRLKKPPPNLKYRADFFLRLIEEFRITQWDDVTHPTIKAILAEVISVVTDGPDVKKAEEERMGYGLFADRDYEEDDKVITEYGGNRLQFNPNVSFTSGPQMGQFGNPYIQTLMLPTLSGDKLLAQHGQTWVVDARLFFRLREKGRWANTIPWDRDNPAESNPNNAEMHLASRTSDNKEIHPIKRIVEVSLLPGKTLKKGEEIFIDYGPLYAPEFLARPPPPEPNAPPLSFSPPTEKPIEYTRAAAAQDLFHKGERLSPVLSKIKEV